MIMPQDTRDYYKKWYDDHSINVCRSAPPHMQSMGPVQSPPKS